MTSRRNLSSEKEATKEHESIGRSAVASTKSDIAPAVPASVIIKLLGFTMAMIGGPIGTYYLTLHMIFKGNSTFAGAMAAVMANVVLMAYIMVAMREDQTERLEAAEKAKKAQ